VGRKEGFPDSNFKIENTSKILKQLKGSQADKIMHFYSVLFHTLLLIIRQGLQQVGSQNLILTYLLQPESIIIFLITILRPRGEVTFVTLLKSQLNSHKSKHSWTCRLFSQIERLTALREVEGSSPEQDKH